jgi:hypothetical protein
VQENCHLTITAVVENETCGLRTEVTVKRGTSRTVDIRLSSDCDAVNKLNQGMGSTLPIEGLTRAGAVRLLDFCLGFLPHVTCPVPLAILRAMEACIGASLPCPLVIRMRKK